jgi:hypothetical protein
MQRQQVHSSNLSSIGYEATSQTLEIQFHSGHVYQYSEVPVTIYNELMSASSHGKYFDRFIKHAFYTTQIQ